MQVQNLEGIEGLDFWVDMSATVILPRRKGASPRFNWRLDPEYGKLTNSI